MLFVTKKAKQNIKKLFQLWVIFFGQSIQYIILNVLIFWSANELFFEPELFDVDFWIWSEQPFEIVFKRSCPLCCQHSFSMA